MIKDKQGKKLSYDELKKKAINRLRNYLLDFELFFLYLVGGLPSHTLRRFFYRLSGIHIGHGSAIHTYFRCFYPKGIIIGDDTIIGDHAFMDGRGKLTIGSHVDIASGVMIYNSQHDVDNEEFRAVEREVIIEDYVFIGPRAIILPGVKIKKGATVGAGAVVTKNVEAFCIVGGVPATFIRERKNTNPDYILGRARLFQ